ncbi:hypothetical protein LT493_22365 [Streptomyces tricolor]|nr:hypothetical protein [Streptomyces tricolor]
MQRHLGSCARCRGAVDELTRLNDRFGAYLATGVLLWAGPAYLATRSASASLAASADAGPARAGKGGSPLTRPAALTAGAAALAVAAPGRRVPAARGPGHRGEPARAGPALAHRAVHLRAGHCRAGRHRAESAAAGVHAAAPGAGHRTALRRPRRGPLAACTGFDADDGELKPAADEHDVPRSRAGLDAQLPRRLARGQLPDARQRCQEWRGWTLTTRDFWERTAPGQYREDFSLGRRGDRRRGSGRGGTTSANRPGPARSIRPSSHRPAPPRPAAGSRSAT